MAWKRGDVPWARREALKLRARPSQVAPTLGTAGCWSQGGSHPRFPPALGRAAGLGAVFAGKRPRAELATPRIGCSVTTRKPGPGRSEPADDGVPQPVCLHPWGGRTPAPHNPPRQTAGPFATGRGGSKPGFIVLRRGATRTLRGELFAASPWTGVYFALIYFPPFVDRCFWLGWSPQALFLSIGAGKGKCHPVLCMKGIINSAQLHLNLPVLTSLQS